jgi:serine/threonine-protein kinase
VPEDTRSAAATEFVAENNLCLRCGLSLAGTGVGGVARPPGFPGVLCQCPSDQTLAEKRMSAKFLKLKQAGVDTIFSRAPSGHDQLHHVSIGLAANAIIGGAYKIIEMIGRGGMGEVYLARHETLGKKCALKVIPPDQFTEESWQRFQLEAKIVAKLEHANLVRVTDLGIHDACLPYFAMDYVDGKNLAEALAELGPMPLKTALEVFIQVCDGVECAHRHGILHRDLKPANVMLVGGKTGKLQAKVLDFGLAKLTKHDRFQQSLTIAGDIFGSPFYMSPEQCNGDELDQRSDIYSLGCTLFECLTGRPPYSGHLAEAVIFGHLESTAPTLESVVGPGIFPPLLEKIMAKLLRKKPDERYQNLEKLKTDLQLVAAQNDLPQANVSRAKPDKSPGTPSAPLVWPDLLPGTNPVNSNDLRLGDIVGGSYQILDQIGSGAMGMIYKAKHVSMPAIYAVKILPADQLNEINALRFQNEAQAIAKLNHPNIISIYNFGLHNGSVPFYVMELLKGDNLERRLELNGPMPVEMVLPLFIEVCDGLNFAHRKGILHRDVKPANFVILDAPDVRGARVKIVDFGMVKFAEQLVPDLQKLTYDGEVCGSPSYMSPEQSSGKKLDPRSDIYSLGCSLYQALTGKLAFLGRSGGETMLLHHEVAAPTLATKGGGLQYSEDLELLVAKMMAKAPMDRYQSMDLVANDLRNLMEGKPLGTPPAKTPPPGQPTGSSGTDPQQVLVNAQQVTLPEFATGPDTLEYRPDNLTGTPTAAEKDSVDASLNRIRTGRSQSAGQNDDDESRIDVRKVNSKGSSNSQARTALLIATLILVTSLTGSVLFLKGTVKRQTRNTTVSKDARSTRQSTSLKTENHTNDSEQNDQPPLDLEGPVGLEDTAPVELTQAPYFSQTISEGGKELVEFDFPKSAKPLNLACIGSSFDDGLRAQGKIQFPKKAKLYLMPLRGSMRVPAFFEKFRPGEITGIVGSPIDASDELLESALKLPGLSHLIIANCSNLSAKVIPSISKLHLTVLDIAGSNLDWKQLAAPHFWQSLEILNIKGCKSAPAILNELNGSTKLTVLDASSNQLTASEYQVISRISSLKVLNISKNTISTEDLKALSGLPNLHMLVAVYTRFADSSSLQELKYFPSLRELIILKGYFKSKDLQALKQECPYLKVTEMSADQIQRDPLAKAADKWK